jgi:glycosyltransferase involved in cell wall biosynthesis
MTDSRQTNTESGIARARPRVVILTNYPVDGKGFTGGVETASAGLLEGLRRYVREFDLHVIALSRVIDRSKTEERDGITFHFLAIPSAWYTRPHLIPNIFNARAKVQELRPDLVHCSDNMGLSIGAVLARPRRKVFTVHGVKAAESQVWQGPQYWNRQMDAVLERWVRRQFNDVIAISPYVDSFLPDHVRKHHITNPVRNLFYENPQTGAGAPPRILFVGVVRRVKRPADLVQAFIEVKRRVPDALLDISGVLEDTLYVEEINKTIAENNLRNIEFLGSRSPEQVAALMRQSSVLVLPSSWENTPMVIAEAMASGLPVIASNVAGVPFMVNDGIDGLLYECGNTQQLGGIVVEVLGNEELRKKLSRNGRQKAVEMFSSDAVAEATANVYRSMLGSAGA